jgi:hypothetical protein
MGLSNSKNVKMEKICGFLDKNNKFHTTEKECEKSNLRIDIQQIERTLNNFSVTVQNYIFRDRGWRRGIDIEYCRHENEIREVVAKSVLLYSDKFIEIINKKKELEKTLDLLKQEKDYQDKWWIKLVWWK